MSKTPRVLAVSLGFKPLSGDQFLKLVPSLGTGEPVGVILTLIRSRMPGEYQYALRTADGKTPVVAGRGGVFHIEEAIDELLDLHLHWKEVE